jgi:hypothetical protein
MRDEALSYAARLKKAGVDAGQKILPAPTGWPCVLARPEPPAEGWAIELSDRVSQFFEETASLLCRAPPVSFVL